MRLPDSCKSARYWLGLMLSCLLVLSGCYNDTTTRTWSSPKDQPPDSQRVDISGRVIGGTGAAGFTVTQINEDGETIATWTTDAQGHYAVQILASDSYHLRATPIQEDAQGSTKPIRMKSAAGEARMAAEIDVQRFEALCESDELTFTCDITPWTTLLLTLANLQEVSIDEIASQLQAMSFYDLPLNEDPFILFDDGILSLDDFDAASVLILISQTDGISQWLAAMSAWVAAPDEADIPASVPQFTVSTQTSAGGTVAPTQQQIARSRASSFVITPAQGYSVLSVTGCGGTLTQTTYETGAITADCEVSVTFSPLQYSLNYQASQGGTLQGSTSQHVVYGASGSEVRAVPDAGYHFVQWSDGKLTNPRIDSNIAADLTLSAVFALNNYQILYAAGNGGSIQGIGSQNINHGAAATTVAAIPSNGYVFVKWSDEVTANPRTDLNITANKSVAAIFELARYSVTYIAGNGGSLTGVASQSVSHGSDASAITAVPNAGYVFVKWDDEVTANPRTDLNITANKSVAAIFELAQYSVTYTAGNGGSLTGVASQSVSHGSDGSAVTAVPNTGYVFVKWDDELTANPRTDLNITANKSVAAIFELAQYSVTYTAGSGGSLTGVASQSINHGSDGSAVTAVPNAGYVFVKWDDEVTANPRTDLNITANKSVAAIFELAQYSVTYTAGSGGSLTGVASQSINHGSDGSAVTAVPNAGYVFVKWDDEVTANPRTDLNVTANKSVAAIFELAQYSVTYTAGSGGSLTGVASQSISHGSDGSAVTAVPDAGYVFVKWDDEVTANPRTDLNITANKSVAAIFELAQYSVTYTAGNGGSLTGVASQTISHGSDASAVTAVPNTGYVFVKWDDEVTANPRTDLNVTANKSVAAIFELAQYSVTYSADTNGSISGQSSQTIFHGSDASSVTAVASTGYVFNQWSDGGTDNPRTDVNVTSNITVIATFSEAPVSLDVAEEYREVINSTSAAQTLSVQNSSGSTAQYLLVPMNLTRADNLSLKIDVANNLVPSSGTAPSAGTALVTDSYLVSRKAQVAEYQTRVGTIGAGTPTSPSSLIPKGVTPNLGDVWTLNANLNNECDEGEATEATVKYVGTNIVVVADNNNPVGGFTNLQYETLGTTVDSFYSSITTLLGTPSDKDENNKVVIFVTAGVNRLSPPASSLTHVAVYSPRDALTQLECPTSNLGEVIYVLAPDPTGAVNDNVRTVFFVEGSAPSHAIHELAGIIIDSRRIAAGYDFEESWLNEGLAAIAQERVFFSLSQLNPLQNIVVSNITTGAMASTKIQAYNTYINAYFGYYRPWLQATTRLGVLDGSGNQMASRGLSWAFLRYVADRHAGSSSAIEGALFRSLVDSPYTGADNIEDLVNGDINQWLHDFLISVYLDDHPTAGLTKDIYSTASWNYRSLYVTLNSAYQLQEMALPVGATTTLTYAKGGSAAYMRFAVGAGETATITFTPTSVPNQQASYTLIRLQ